MIAEQPSLLADLRPVIEKAVKHLPGEVRYRAQNSFEGFRRAKTLLPIDREIASFRAITAEEEAAAALFRSLQIRGYAGAESLSLKLHQHKVAATFFLSAITHALVGDAEAQVSVTVRADPPKVTIALPVKQFAGLDDAPDNLHLELVEPLGLTYRSYGDAPDDRFEKAIKKAAGDRNVDKLIAKAANARNRILYAHDTGAPISQATIESIAVRERNADLFLLLAIAVLQVETQQAMATQCLQAFLKVIKRAQAEVFT